MQKPETHAYVSTRTHSPTCAPSFVQMHTRNPLAQFQRPELRGDSPVHTPTSLPRPAQLSPLHCRPLSPSHSKLLH